MSIKEDFHFTDAAEFIQNKPPQNSQKRVSKAAVGIEETLQNLIFQYPKVLLKKRDACTVYEVRKLKNMDRGITEVSVM